MTGLVGYYLGSSCFLGIVGEQCLKEKQYHTASGQSREFQYTPITKYRGD